jgi:hypothetical protein
VTFPSFHGSTYGLSSEFLRGSTSGFFLALEEYKGVIYSEKKPTPLLALICKPLLKRYGLFRCNHSAIVCRNKSIICGFLEAAQRVQSLFFSAAPGSPDGNLEAWSRVLWDAKKQPRQNMKSSTRIPRIQNLSPSFLCAHISSSTNPCRHGYGLLLLGQSIPIKIGNPTDPRNLGSNARQLI